ncbi:MAG: hypothetical protein HC867_08690 [Bacteroidia bacterium]|nr:hypothetical protein [Bacteroidia bacterium]
MGASGKDKFDDIFMMQAGNQNMNDQIELIKSTPIARRVVKALNLQTSYYNKGNIRSGLLHRRETPFLLEIVTQYDSAKGFSLPVRIISPNEFVLGENNKPIAFGQVFQRPEGMFKLIRTDLDIRSFKSNEFLITRQAEEGVARSLAGGIKVAQVGNNSNVLSLSYETQNTKIGKEIVDGFMNAYKDYSLEEKREVANNTTEFIKKQMTDVRDELGIVERNLQNYRENNRTFNVQKQSDLFISDLSETDKELYRQESQVKVVDILIKNVSNREMVPSTLGIDEPSLVQAITEYNKLQLQKQTSLKTTPATNPVIIDLETGIEKLRSDILENLKNVREAYMLAVNDLKRKTNYADAQIRSMPSKEKQLLEITRQQK